MPDELNYEKGSYYIMDKGYVDFTRLHKLHTGGAYFVTRAKGNMRFRRMYSLLDKTSVREMLTDCDYKNVKELNYKQLKISWD